MKILALYPHFDVEIYSISYALVYLSDMDVQSVVITSKAHTSKGTGKSDEFDVIRKVLIYRIYENCDQQFSYLINKYKYNKIYNIAKEFKPDLIFCSHQRNMLLAKQLRNDFNIPIVLLVEFARNPILLLGKRRYYLGIKKLAPLVAKLYWRWLCKQSSAVITCYIGDKKYLNRLSKYGIPVYYVPWCNQIPKDYSNKKNKYRGIYVGSLSDFKNSTEFAKTLPLIMENTPTKEFWIIGDGPRTNIIKDLQENYPEWIKLLKPLPREDVLHLISNSYYCYTPVILGGWGFIGDSWAVKTPLIVTHNNYAFNDRVDTLVAENLDEVHTCINELYKNQKIYQTLQENGYKRYLREHSAESVGKQYYEIFKRVIKERQGKFNE